MRERRACCWRRRDGIFVRDGLDYFAVRPIDYASEAAAHGGGDAVVAPMHGKVTALFVAVGDTVARGQRIAIVEAMKMEHVLTSPRDGVVEQVTVEAGAQAAQGALIVRLIAALGGQGERG